MPERGDARRCEQRVGRPIVEGRPLDVDEEEVLLVPRSGEEFELGLVIQSTDPNEGD